jgi:hypothetical protein
LKLEEAMRLPRYTIRSLLGVVLFVAIAAAALRASTDAWDGCLLGLTSLILPTAILLAVHRSDRRRAFWLGFALFGWTYLIASLIPPIGSRLPTTMGLAFIDSKIPGRETTTSAILTYGAPNPAQTIAVSARDYTLVSLSQGNAYRVWDTTTGKLLAGPGGTTENFIRIGHSLLALLLAFLGGHLSRHLYGRRRQDRSIPPGDSPASP